MSRTSSGTKEMVVSLRYIGGLGEVVVNNSIGEEFTSGVISAVDAKEQFKKLEEYLMEAIH